MSGVEDEVLNISHRFSSALLRNPSVVRYALRECGGADGTYKLLHLVEYLLKLPSVRGSLEEITCHGIKHIVTRGPPRPESNLTRDSIPSNLSESR